MLNNINLSLLKYYYGVVNTRNIKMASKSLFKELIKRGFKIQFTITVKISLF